MPPALRLVLFLTLLPMGPLLAQPVPMTDQACLLSCMTEIPDRSSEDFRACTRHACSFPKPRVPTQRWTSGPTSDLTGAWAGQRNTDNTGISVICAPGGHRWLAIHGIDGPSATVILRIDGTPWPVPLIEGPRAHSLHLSEGDPRLQALARGRRLDVLNVQGEILLSLGLEGAALAMDEALAACP